MKKIVNRIVNAVGKFFSTIFGSSKMMVNQIDQFVDEKIDEKYENMKTGKPREDRKNREKVKFFTGVVFILCLVLILAIPVSFMFSKVKRLLVEASIKTPDEITMQLGDHAEENYPDIDKVSGVYINDSSAKQVGYFWEGEETTQIPILQSDDGYILSQKINEGENLSNFLLLQYDSGVNDVIKVYDKDMNVFCMMSDPVLYGENSYIAANPYITLHATPEQAKWEIFAYYEGYSDEMEMLLMQKSKTDMYHYLVQKSGYHPDQVESEEENENADELQDYIVAEFTGNILVVVAEDKAKDTRYIIGAKCES